MYLMELSIAIGVVGAAILLLSIFARSIVGKEIISAAFNLEENLKILRDLINFLTARIDEYSKRNPNRNEWEEKQLEEMVGVKEEAERLRDEVVDVMKHWYTGWATGSRYILSKRIKALTSKVGFYSCGVYKRGRVARRVISDIDERIHIVPVAISDYLNFNTNVAKLRQKIFTNTQPPSPPLGYSSEQVAQKWVELLEASKKEGMKLIQEAEDMEKNWYKKWSVSRYRLSKRIVKMVAELDELSAAHWRDLIVIRVEGKRDCKVQISDQS